MVRPKIVELSDKNQKAMKTTSLVSSKNWLFLFLTLISGMFLGATNAQAGLTVDIHLYHDIYGYYFYPYLSANNTPPDYPIGDYLVASPQIPTGGSRLVFTATANSFSECIDNDCGGGAYYGNFDDLIYGITNGLWSIWVTNGASLSHYNFRVTVTGLTSNIFGAQALLIYPNPGTQTVPNDPQFLWSGPTNWAGTLTVQDNLYTNGNNFYVDRANLPASQTNWTPSVVLPYGTNGFSVDYQSNVTAMIVAATPTNGTGQPICGWISTATLESGLINGQTLFNVGQSGNPFDAFLVGRYDFEITNSPGTDSSGNGNDTDCYNSGAQPDVASTNAAVGSFARLFFGDTSYCFTSYGGTFLSLSNALTGSFSVTAWVNTTNSVNFDNSDAYYGLPILFLYSSNTNGTVPLTITGSKAAFTIYDQNGNAVTLHSTSTVNDGHYHFLAVTRAQSSGLMSLYVDGNLQATGTSTTQPLQIPWIHLAGGYYIPYQGLLDDVRIYSTNLAAADIATLALGGKQETLGQALNATNLSWSTSGDNNWFIETTNTCNSSPAAAQSGIVVNSEISTLTATVAGPGRLTFYWSVIANESFDYEFDIDGTYADDIYTTTDWYQETDPQTSEPYFIPSGLHTLTWTAYANGDTDPTEAGFLGQVYFTPTDTTPVSASITLDIYRGQDPNLGDIYIVFPWIDTITPDGTGNTTNTLESPNGWFSDQDSDNNGGSSSAIMYSLGQVLDELTNGLWTIHINKGQQIERQFQFSVSVTGLTTNLLSVVKIIAPTNGATGISTTTAFQWSGLTNYSDLTVSKQNADGSGYVSADLPLTDNHWPSPPVLAAGTNQFDINYTSNSFPGITFTVPVDTVDSQTISGWSANANLHSTARSLFTVMAGPMSAALLNPHQSGTNFQFSFVSQSGYTNTIQYRTNLVAGANWQTYSNILGDGTLKTISIPFSIFSPARQGFMRLLTQ